MSKSTNKRNNYNYLVVTRISKKYGVTKSYTRMCLRGDRVCETCDTIKKEYKQLVKQVETALNQ